MTQNVQMELNLHRIPAMESCLQVRNHARAALLAGFGLGRLIRP